MKKLTIADTIRNILDNDSKWTCDRYGNYISIIGDRKYRVKLQKTSIRYEVYSSNLKEWINLRSDYYKNIVIEDNKISIKGRVIGSVIGKVI